VNADAASTGTIRLSFADATGYTGVVEVAKLTFRATTTVGTSGTFRLAASELSAADYSSLLGSLVQVTQPIVIR
jgi:hypothetical protein